MHFLCLYIEKNCKQALLKYVENNGYDVDSIDRILAIKEEIQVSEDVNNSILAYLTRLLPYKEIFYTFAKNHIISLWLTLYPESYQLNLHLSNQVIVLLEELGFEIDVTVMSLQDLYNGKYDH